MKYLLLFITSIFFITCTSDFDSINENPNSPEDIDPQFLLTNVLSVLADENTYEQGFRQANYITQFSASVEFERIDRYEMGSNSEFWTTLYSLITDLNSIQTVGNSNEAYVAVANILKSYIFSLLTDMWGDVPYTEAGQGQEGLVTPVYDSQESIYMDPETGLFRVLKDAVAVLGTTNTKIEGDIMYSNDLEKWIRFGNSLQVRYYLRVSNRISDFSELQKLVEDNRLLRSNNDNAVVPYLSAAPNQFPLSQASQGTYQEHRMTKKVEEVLNSWNDPRISILYKPSNKSIIDGNPNYHGLTNGMSRETISSSNIDLNDISLFGSIFRDETDGIDGQIMLYSELQFALAEAVLKGYVSGVASDYYEGGIISHFDYLGITATPEYLEQDLIKLGSEEDIKKVLTQKWLSLNTNGHEAWFNIRRTGIPELTPGPDNLNGDRYPVRYLYPESEQTTNTDNYSAASQRIGGDDINSKSWWEI